MKPVRVVKRRNRAVLLALLVIVCAVAIVFLYTLWTNHVWSREIYQLKHKASNLYSVIEHQRNEFRELQNALGESNSSLLNNEKGNITFLEKIAALQDEMTEMRSDMHQMRTKVDSVKSYAENTYQGLNNLGERFEKYIRDSRVVNLADHCSTETEQCSVPSSSNQGKYWKSCRTVKVGLNIPVRISVIVTQTHALYYYYCYITGEDHP